METKNPNGQGSGFSYDACELGIRDKSDDTHRQNFCKANLKKIIVKFGSHAPDLAYFLLNIFRLRGA